MKKDLLKITDLSCEDITHILDVADQLKYNQKHGIPHRLLEGKTLAMIFQKSSTRTRVSFDVGMFQLGGHAMFLSTADIQMGRGESIRDTARVLSRYCDGIMIRTYGQDEVEELAEYATIPVINGLTDYSHPCQVLADLMTIREHQKTLEGLHMCYIGDGNNMANSLVAGGLITGMKVTCATPKGYEPDPQILDFAKKYGDKFSWHEDVMEAARGADILVTDVWASMGQEEEREERARIFQGYQINEAVMQTANKGAIVLHCLPAHKGEEITEDVFEKYADCIFDEAENRLHAQKAVMAICMGETK
ncbi:MAG: ornithine carbamoyltransferase [Clostridia bacterium]|nr:ornithine carbamoyltransferase [Clostridia bacterium]